MAFRIIIAARELNLTRENGSSVAIICRPVSGTAGGGGHRVVRRGAAAAEISGFNMVIGVFRISY